MCRVFASLGCLALVTACGTPSETAAAKERCPPAQEAPRSIEAIVQTLNAMPKPVELPCLIETLPRPLAIHASTSMLSLQPAFARESPRIFIFTDPLILAVVPDGDGQHLLEMSEQRAEARTIKAELAFPVEAELSQAAPFEHVLFNETTTSCAFCHGGETRVESNFARVYESQALRPGPDQRVPLDEVARSAASCAADASLPRCALLRAIFDNGTVVSREFPDSFGLFL